MPDTPVLWRSQFQASSGSTAQSGFEPVVVALTNDNFAVFWQNDGTGANGVDIRGQIFDPLGNPIGGSFRANQTFFADDERNFDVAALPNGGFVVVYEDFDDATGRIDIRATEWTTTIDGGIDSSTSFTVRSDPGANQVRNPSVAANSSGGYVVSYDYDTSVFTEARYRYVNPSNTLGTEYAATTSNSFSSVDTDTAFLSNGNYVVVYESDDGAPERSISFLVRTTAGAVVQPSTQVFGTAGTGADERDPAVAATNFSGIPGFVVVWRDDDGTDTDIRYQVYSATGTTSASLGGFVGNTGGSDNHVDPQVFALPLGFIVTWRDVTDDVLRFQRFNTTGDEVGGVVTVDNGGRDLSGVRMEDGRLVFVFRDSPSDEIFVEIYDPRDAENDPGAGPNRVSVGTVGNDVFNEDFGIDRIFGWTGDDRVNVTTNLGTDIFDGGTGNDTIDWSTVNELGPMRLWLDLGYAEDGSGNREDMLNFENLIGTDQDDNIRGTNGANNLEGGAGNDSLVGFDGDDTLRGGTGDDLFIANVDGSTDEVFGGSGTDTLEVRSINFGWTVTDTSATNFATNVTLSSIETIIGSSRNDTISEVTGTLDDMRGEGGDDLIVTDMDDVDRADGGAGNDTLDARGRSIGDPAVIFNMGSGTFNGTFATNFENFYSAAGDDIIFGTNGANEIRGGSGDDTITPGAGNDTIRGESGDDAIDANSGTNTVFGGLGNDTIVSSGAGIYNGELGDDEIRAGLGSAETLDGGDGIDLLVTTTFNGNYSIDLVSGVTNFSGESFTDFENVVTGNGNDTIFGTNGANLIDTGDGNDSIEAGAGNDTIDAGPGNDTVRAGDGDDSIVGADTNGFDSIFGGAGNDTITSSGEDTVFGEAGNDLILAGLGTAERLDGGAGNDMLDTTLFNGDYVVDLATGLTNFAGESFVNFENIISGGGNDALFGTAANNGMSGGLGNDRILGFAGNDFLIGDAGADTLNGGDGNDTMDAGDGIDRVYAGAGNDTVFAGDGDDSVEGQVGNDFLRGSLGNDLLRGADGFDDIDGGAGNDTAFGGNDDDTLFGGDGNDSLDGSGGDDFIDGGAGNDILVGETGADTIFGGTGMDTIRGGGGGDVLDGEEDNDLIFGSADRDTIFGGEGDDVIEGNQQGDELFGEAGNDTLRAGDGFDLLVGGDGNDTLLGQNGNDTLVGGLGQDLLLGGAQGDTFDFNSTAESFTGGEDIINFIEGIGVAGGDLIDVSDIDADTNLRGAQSFTFLGNVSTATGLAFGAGALWVEDGGGQVTILRGNTDNDNFIEFAVLIGDGAGVTATDYTAEDFLL